MLERIIVGIIIGFIGGFFISKQEKDQKKDQKQGIVLAFIAIISIAFIGSSFMYGAIFGIMAIVEIVIGYAIASKIFLVKKLD